MRFRNSRGNSVPRRAIVVLLLLASNFALLNTGCSSGGQASSTALVPNITSLNPASAVAGTSVTITGTSLIQATKVTFGGVAATSFTVNSDTQITAIVPTGAKTGKIAVTTKGGASSSAASFTVQ